ncbi:MAG: molybdopterin converting factor subunit 1 [Bryobacteraceae bacterium]
MRVRVLFFGKLRDMAGRAEEETEIAEGADLAAVFAAYAARYPAIDALRGRIAMARNQEFAEPSARLAEGDEIAFLPPVSGGSGEGRAETGEIREEGLYCAIVRNAINTRALAASLLNGAEGAVVTFEGTVRNHTNGRTTRCLDYEGYVGLALTTMAGIGRELAAAHDISRFTMVHRLGRVLIGETSVAVIATAPHRRAAFQAALEGIDRIKRLVPIWKKEHFADGEVWVEGEWDRDVPVVE